MYTANFGIFFKILPRARACTRIIYLIFYNIYNNGVCNWLIYILLDRSFPPEQGTHFPPNRGRISPRTGDSISPRTGDYFVISPRTGDSEIYNLRKLLCKCTKNSQNFKEMLLFSCILLWITHGKSMKRMLVYNLFIINAIKLKMHLVKINSFPPERGTTI